MGKMHDRFKAASMRVTAVDISKLNVDGAKAHYIAFAAKGLVDIFTRKTNIAVTQELVTPLATLLEAISSLDREQMGPAVKSAKMRQALENIGAELHKVSVKLGINDSDPAIREYVQKHIGDLLSETNEEVLRFNIDKFTKDFMNTPSEPGATIVASGMGGPMFEAMDMSRFKAK